MSRQARHDWVLAVGRQFRRAASKRRSVVDSCLYRRRLGFEPLEDRRMLSITVNTLVDENDGIGVGGISLRDAIVAAAPGDTIDFAPALTSGGPAVLLLTNGQLTISKSLTINGPGAELLTIDASGNDPTPDVNNGDGSRVFVLNDANSSALSSASISGVTLTGGDSAGSGGAIQSYENLNLTAVAITGNAAKSDGGGIASRFSGLAVVTITDSTLNGNFSGHEGGALIISGTATITRSTISGNQAGFQGGGIGIASARTVTIYDSTISDNTASSGGGIYSSRGTKVGIYDSVISNNYATGSGGGLADKSDTVTIARSQITKNGSGADAGGILFTSSNSLTISQSTISNNTAKGNAGGLLLQGSDVTLSDSTISGNVAGNSGGGILATGSTFSARTIAIRQCTISGNRAAVNGGGIFANLVANVAFKVQFCTVTDNVADSNNNGYGAEGGGGIALTGQDSLILEDSIVAKNFAGFSEDDIRIFSGAIAPQFNLIGSNAGSGLAAAPIGLPDANGNLIGSSAVPIDPKLGTLGDNGGVTQTIPLFAGSPAIDTGDPSAVAGAGEVSSFDQRREPFGRVFDGDGANGARIDIGAYERQSNAPAQTLVVDTLKDERDGDYSIGDFSLREAIGQANGNVDVNETITFAPALDGGTILLTLGQLVVSDGVTIDASALVHGVVLDAAGSDPTPGVRHADGSRVLLATSDLELRHLTLTGGDVLGQGGAVSAKNLVLSDSMVVGNAASQAGGGVATTGGQVTRSTISGNWAGGTGGGLYARMFNSNETVRDSTISGNFSLIDGGGVELFVISGGATILQSTVSGNFANGSGGGVKTYGTASISLSTIVGNTANADHDALGSGGGVFVSSGLTSIRNSIVAQNVDRSGFGPDIEPFGGGQVTVAYSLVGDRTGLASVGETLSGPDSHGNWVGGPVFGALDPLLGPLVNNGGPTKTHALHQFSRAVDGGDPSAVGGIGDVPMYDQREIVPYSRIYDGDFVIGARIDMGAYEYQSNPTPGDYNFDGFVNAADYTVWRDTVGSANDFRADGDHNSRIDANDYQVWKDNFGTTGPHGGFAAGAGASVQEQGASRDSIQTPPVVAFSRSAGTAPAPLSPRLAPQMSRDNALLAWLALRTGQDLGAAGQSLSIASYRDVAADEASVASGNDDFDSVDQVFDALGEFESLSV
jgi:parallel beta-helix repeat protein